MYTAPDCPKWHMFHAVQERTEITPKNVTEFFTLEERPVTDIPKAAYVALDELVGQFIRQDIDENSIVTKSMTGELETAYDNMVVLSIDMKALEQSVAGTLRAGDKVDIYTIHTDKEEQVLAEKVMNEVTIIRSYTGSGASIVKEDDTSIAQYITIPVHKEAVEAFYKSLENKKIEVVKYPE